MCYLDPISWQEKKRLFMIKFPKDWSTKEGYPKIPFANSPVRAWLHYLEHKCLLRPPQHWGGPRRDAANPGTYAIISICKSGLEEACHLVTCARCKPLDLRYGKNRASTSTVLFSFGFSFLSCHWDPKSNATLGSFPDDQQDTGNIYEVRFFSCQ